MLFGITTGESSIGDAPFLTLREPIEGSFLNFGIDSPLAIADSASVPSYSGETIVVPVSSAIAPLVSIRIDGTTYSPAVDPDDPQPGEFVVSGGNATVSLVPGSAPEVGSPIALTGLSNSYPDAELPSEEVLPPHPALYSEWNVDSEVSFSWQFEGHPSATFKFFTTADQRSTVLTRFRNELGSEVRLYGWKFRIESVSIKELSVSAMADALLECTVQLSGKWAYRMGLPFRVLKAFPSHAKGVEEWVTLSALCTSQGLNYEGQPLKFRIEKDATSETTTTIEDAISSQVRLNEGFVFLSDADAIEVRKWGETREHFLSPADVFSAELEYTYPGKEFVYQGVQLAEVYKNSVLNLGLGNEDQQGDRTKVRRRWVCEPKEDPSIPPVEVRDLRDPGRAFDNGGITKVQKCTLWLGDTELESYEITYGFAFRAIDVYYYAVVSVTSGTPPTTKEIGTHIYDESVDPGHYWIPVRSTRTVYRYNSYGYQTELIEGGTRTARLKTESDRETLALDLDRQKLQDRLATAAPEDVNSINRQINLINLQLDAYRFAYVLPTAKNTNVDLAGHAALYPDIQASREQGGSNAEDDPAYVPPYYAQSVRVFEESYTAAYDPASTPFNPKPPKATGKSFDSRKTISIVSTIKGEEAYTETDNTSNSEGTDLKNGLSIGLTRVVKGRPPVHQRGDIAQTIANGGVVPEGAEDPIDPSGYKFLLNTEGNNYPADGVEQGSVSYETASVEAGRKAAELDQSIKNTKESEQLNLTVRRDLKYQEGDLVRWRDRRYVIFGIGMSEKIAQGQVTCEGMKLTLGRFLRPKTLLTKVPTGTQNGQQ